MFVSNKKRITRVMLKNAFSRELKAVRKSHKLTQTEFAEKIGVSLTSVSNYECGKAIPSPKTINRIYQEFNLDDTALFDVRELRRKDMLKQARENK